jgi:hypothetical protein
MFDKVKSGILLVMIAPMPLVSASELINASSKSEKPEEKAR